MQTLPEVLLSDRDFREKIKVASNLLNAAPTLDLYVSLKLRFFPGPEYFDAPDYRLISSRFLTRAERELQWQRPSSHVDFSHVDFFDGDAGPHNITAGIVEFAMSDQERFLLARHETGPEIIVVLAVVAGSLALAKEIVSLVVELGKIHAYKDKRLYELKKRDMEKMQLEKDVQENLLAQWAWMDVPPGRGKYLSLERRQYVKGKLVQEVVLKVPLEEMAQHEDVISAALASILKRFTRE